MATRRIPGAGSGNSNNNNGNNGNTNPGPIGPPAWGPPGGQVPAPPKDPTVPPTPPTPSKPKLPFAKANPIKPVTPQYFALREREEAIANRLENLVNNYFQQMGGRELINLTNNNNINSISGQIPNISNMFQINFKYKVDNLIPVPSPLPEILNAYTLKFNSYVPESGDGPGGTIVYFDANKNLIIETTNLGPSEKVQVEILNSGDLFDGTIYKRNTE